MVFWPPVAVMSVLTPSALMILMPLRLCSATFVPLSVTFGVRTVLPAVSVVSSMLRLCVIPLISVALTQLFSASHV